MSDIAISVEGLSKSYLVGRQAAQREAYSTLRDVISRSGRRFARKAVDVARGRQIVHGDEVEEFWALKDVSFEIKRGEVFGIIGRNGAGKSTLLKILSRITEPTSGRVTIKGRVASLLEVGTGFHPELTGRENVYLNGAILGMNRSEIRSKFDEIVTFAEVEKFLDTPVKRYSTGMYVRLAFAVAAHLEPEILIVDEVLAVGDMDFQRKCIGKMSQVAGHGRTVLFVSHNMGAVQQLCGRVGVLQAGGMHEPYEEVSAGIAAYLRGINRRSGDRWAKPAHASCNDFFDPVQISITYERQQLSVNEPFSIEIVAVIRRISQSLTIGFDVFSDGGIHLFRTYQTDASQAKWPSLRLGINKFIVKIPANLLNEGKYTLKLVGGLHNLEWLFPPEGDAPEICVRIDGPMSESPHWVARRPGLLAPLLEWTSCG